jgi:hypothetical protein
MSASYSIFSSVYDFILENYYWDLEVHVSLNFTPSLGGGGGVSLYMVLTLISYFSAIVIGHTAEGSQQGYTNKGVAVIAEYLETMNM